LIDAVKFSSVHFFLFCTQTLAQGTQVEVLPDQVGTEARISLQLTGKISFNFSSSLLL